MTDDQFQASGNWWDSARNLRFESGESQSSSSCITNIGNFTWQQQDVAETTQKLEPPNHHSATSSDPNMHMMDLGLSSQAMDWNQASLLGEKAAESSFRSMLQETMSSPRTNIQQESGVGLSQQVQWKSQKLFTEEYSTNEFKQVNKGFSLDQNQFTPQYSTGDSNLTSQAGLHSTFQVDSSALYGTPSSILQGVLLGPDNNNSSVNFPYPKSYGSNSSNHELVPSWSKVPQFLRASSPPKQPPSSFFPPLQTPFSMPNFDVQSKNISEVRDSGTVVKKSGNESASKRPRNETSSPLPAFKVRKEKMGDRITALQQLVSPFGKTDTASVLSEAIEFIKFLHQQVNVLSAPYMKSGAPVQIQQSSDKFKEEESPKQDLRSRGLCLVPASTSTFPMTHDTIDFWTSTFGGTSR
ncbi:hypothetical protein TanjilG_11811 [Lupinus angustifolius]|uniref:BHLH domain-containing protein n=1 Tax=Lupinus angustifolius TaxID=3871 RepID=A0A4P1R645_LUPAN|nr:PREDICTED: transcription factor bHLH123-like isoform X2 [Lupinus angustifolius]OIW03174.1 hypothetical protein TanjilG_11811 [Lupinus angustifolius]